jgi:hypothetical protein
MTRVLKDTRARIWPFIFQSRLCSSSSIPSLFSSNRVQTSFHLVYFQSLELLSRAFEGSMPRAKRTLREVDANASVSAPATRSKRSKAVTIADGKENDAALDQLQYPKGKPCSAASRRKQAVKVRAADCASNLLPVSASDIGDIFDCLKSTEDPAMAAANKAYQKASP